MMVIMLMILMMVMMLMMVFLFTTGTRTLGFARDTARSQAQMTGSVEMMKQAG